MTEKRPGPPESGDPPEPERDGPQEAEDAARQELDYPEDETNEG